MSNKAKKWRRILGKRDSSEKVVWLKIETCPVCSQPRKAFYTVRELRHMQRHFKKEGIRID